MRKIALVLLFTLTIGLLLSCSPKTEPAELELAQMKNICDLATLECKYNNVAMSIKEKEEGLTHIGEVDREFWIEYIGTVTLGIDMDKVSFKVNEDKVKITLPKVEILSVGCETDSFNIIVAKDGINKNKITFDDQRNAVEKAQNTMVETLKENKTLFNNAEERAKKLLENYVEQIGKQKGIEYSIEWKTAK